MVKFGSGSKPANQGSPGTAHVQKPKTSGKPAKGGEAPTNAQDKRGFHTPGKGGSGTTANKPKSF